MQHLNRRLTDMAAMLKTPADRMEDKIAQLRESLKQAEKQVEDMRKTQAAAVVAELAQQVENINGVNCLIRRVAADGKTLRDMVMQLRSLIPAPAAILLAGNKDGAAAFVAAMTADIKSGGASAWLQQAATVAGAKGGGKKDFAQAGGGAADKIEAALQAAEEWIRSLSH